MYDRYLIITFVFAVIIVCGIFFIYKHYIGLTLLESAVVEKTASQEEHGENASQYIPEITVPSFDSKTILAPEDIPPDTEPERVRTVPPPPEPIDTNPASKPVSEQEPSPAYAQDEEKPNLTFDAINFSTREALVNIFCTTQGPHETITPISGSGIIIDERGVILTNAHIGQYFLLEDFPTDGFVNCSIRTGSPAEARYRAELLYISPPWVAENAALLTLEEPTGTGEHDFALLLINEALNNNELPEHFPFVQPEVDENAIVPNTEVLIGAYPAGFLGGSTVQKDLFIATSIVTIAEFFTFESGTLDVLSLGGSIVAQQGSSGGGVVNALGTLIGLISTSSGGETTEDRDLRAITLAHIERSLLEHNKTTLGELLTGNIAQKAGAFNATVVPTLLQILINALK